MKYIRTKDGIYDKIDEMWQLASYPPQYELTKNGEHLGYAFCKDCQLADTIEELCDWFIVEGDDNKITYHKTLFSAKTDGKDYILESNEAYTIYGCVLVKGKGLIYVAKINDKGELELL